MDDDKETQAVFRNPHDESTHSFEASRRKNAEHWALRIMCSLVVWALWSVVVHAQPPAVLDAPVRAVVDAQSNVFVTESTARRIAKFNPSGALVRRFGGSS